MPCFASPCGQGSAGMPATGTQQGGCGCPARVKRWGSQQENSEWKHGMEGGEVTGGMAWRAAYIMACAQLMMRYLGCAPGVGEEFAVVDVISIDQSILMTPVHRHILLVLVRTTPVNI